LILIWSDTSKEIEQISKYLGFEILSCKSTDEALQIIDENDPDITIVALGNSKENSGIPVLNKLRA
jgi:8-oxo-dGTP pyrophosphatase MutT (NUDIX family)/CheY-like chemotaxis protein